MNETAFHTAHQAFLDRLSYLGTSPLQADQQHFLHAALKAVMDTLTGNERLLITHLGLEGTAMRYGFSVRKGSPRDGGLDFDPIGDPTHILDNGAFLPITPLAWKPFHDAYRTKVYLTREGGAPVPVGPDDARAVILHWDKEVDRMYRETSKGVADEFRMMLSSVAVEHDSKDGGPAGYRHGVSYHCERNGVAGWRALLNDTPYTLDIFYYKAADYGNLCPPYTNRFQRG
jgi:hypothetical protein